MRQEENKPLFDWTSYSLWLLGSITILSAIARFATTGNLLLTGEPPAEPSDANYVTHPWLSAIHIVPGVLFLLLGPLQFSPSIRARWPNVHRQSGRIFVVCGLITAATAIVIELVFPPIGGLAKRAAIFVFSLAMFLSLIVALNAVLQTRIAQHRAWMIRAFAIGLSLSTTRLFFVPAYLLYGLPSDFTAGLITWLGFLINSAGAEILLRRGGARTRRT